MNTYIKVLLTILIAVSSVFMFVMCVAIAGTSHKMTDTSRESKALWGLSSIIIALSIITAIWLPWKKMMKR